MNATGSMRGAISHSKSLFRNQILNPESGSSSSTPASLTCPSESTNSPARVTDPYIDDSFSEVLINTLSPKDTVM